jgi:hypothetical protein
MLSARVYIHTIPRASLSEYSAGAHSGTCICATAKEEVEAACWKEEVKWLSWHMEGLPVVADIIILVGLR